MLEGASRAQVNPKLNEDLVSNLLLKHYIHYQIFLGLLSAKHCVNYYTCFPYGKSEQRLLHLS